MTCHFCLTGLFFWVQLQSRLESAKEIVLEMAEAGYFTGQMPSCHTVTQL